MEKRGVWIFGSIAFVLTLALSFMFDSQIVQAVSKIRGNLLNEFFFGITFVSSEIIIFFLLTSLFLWKDHKRRWILPLWVTLGISIVISFFIKWQISRPRPFQQGIVSTPEVLTESLHAALDFIVPMWNFSFPSFQAMMVFCAIPIIAKEFKKTKWVWVAFAVLVAFSRIYFGMHFLSDLLVGGAIGYLVGLGIVKLEEKYEFGNKTAKKLGIKKI